MPDWKKLAVNNVLNMIMFIIIFELVLIWPVMYVVNKWLKKKNLANSGLIASIFILVIFTLIPIGYYQYKVRFLNPKMRSAQFDSHIWKSEETERFTMVKDIIDNELFKGKTKSQIFALLGTDYETGPCNNCIGYSTYDPDIGFSIDHDVLAVYFDSLDNVIEIRSDMW